MLINQMAQSSKFVCSGRISIIYRLSLINLVNHCQSIPNLCVCVCVSAHRPKRRQDTQPSPEQGPRQAPGGFPPGPTLTTGPRVCRGMGTTAHPAFTEHPPRVGVDLMTYVHELIRASGQPDEVVGTTIFSLFRWRN